jgi:hypothetical protein
MSAILVGFSPIEPPPMARKLMGAYEIATDPDTDISIEYRAWGDPDCDADKHVFEVNYGYAKGEANALKRMTVRVNETKFKSSAMIRFLNTAAAR